MKHYWIKLWVEILDDDKIGMLPEYMKWRMIELFLVAGENGQDGLLPPVARLAWRLRLDDVKIAETLSALTQVGVVTETPEGWRITNFAKRQESKEAERQRRYRDTHRYSNVTVTDKVTDNVTLNDSESVSDSVSISASNSLTPVDAEFYAHFGEFHGQREMERWRVLSEAIGFEHLQDIATWAEKREIHMMNRPALLDSLETAAKKWQEKPPGGNGNHQKKSAYQQLIEMGENYGR